MDKDNEEHRNPKKGNQSLKNKTSIDWKLPLLSGQNLDILLKECEKLQDKGKVANKKKKYTPNLNYTRKPKTEGDDDDELSDTDDCVKLEETRSPVNNKPIPKPKKQMYKQSEGLNIFDMDKISISRSSKFGKLAGEFNTENSDLKHVIDMLRIEDRQPLDFKTVYFQSKSDDEGETVPYSDLPIGLPYYEESKKSVYQKIQEIEAPEDYESMYVNCKQFSEALNLNSKNSDMSPRSNQPQILVLQTAGLVPALIEREPKFDGEEKITISDNEGQTTSGYKCTFKDLPEGQIGMLQILKSGKMKLQLGECDFWLTKSMETGIKEEIMAISCDKEDKFAALYNLGDVDDHIFATPDFLMDSESRILKDPYYSA